MSMMKKFNNLFVNEDDFEDEVVEKEEVRNEQPKPRAEYAKSTDRKN